MRYSSYYDMERLFWKSSLSDADSNVVQWNPQRIALDNGTEIICWHDGSVDFASATAKEQFKSKLMELSQQEVCKELRDLCSLSIGRDSPSARCLLEELVCRVLVHRNKRAAAFSRLPKHLKRVSSTVVPFSEMDAHTLYIPGGEGRLLGQEAAACEMFYREGTALVMVQCSTSAAKRTEAGALAAFFERIALPAAMTAKDVRVVVACPSHCAGAWLSRKETGGDAEKHAIALKKYQQLLADMASEGYRCAVWRLNERFEDLIKEPGGAGSNAAPAAAAAVGGGKKRRSMAV